MSSIPLFFLKVSSNHSPVYWVNAEQATKSPEHFTTEARSSNFITDLLGIHLGNGFDTSNNLRARITWSRMSAKDRDEIQRNVDPSSNTNILKHHFINLHKIKNS